MIIALVHNLAALLKSGADGERVVLVTRIYQVVHGRPPDQGGLAAYVQHMRDGKTLPELVTAFLDSAEFTNRIGDNDPASVIWQGVFGAGAGSPVQMPDQTLVGLVLSLIGDAALDKFLPILPALYPDGVRLDDPLGYRFWLSEKRRQSVADDSSAHHGPNPLISFIMLLDHPNPGWIDAAIASVLAQRIVPVEMLLVGSGRFPEPVRQHASLDPRLRMVRAPFWPGAASWFNRGLARSRGRFTGLMGQHDLLDESAAADLAAGTQAADIILSDDDRLDEHGMRHSPRLGAAWDPDRVVAAGLQGFAVAQTALLRAVGGMRHGAGLGEWDLLLRASAVSGSRIVHLPSILLSRRAPAGAPHGSHKPQRAAALGYLKSGGHRGCRVRPEGPILRVIYPLPKIPPLASIIIPTRDRADLLRTCTDGLLHRTAYPEIEILILDNGSTEPDAVALLQDLARDNRVRVLPRPGAFNWSALNNAGVDQMRGGVVILLNNDTDVIDPDWLREMVSQAIRPEVGVVGAKLLYANRTIQHAGVVLGPAGQATHMWRHAPGDAGGYLDVLVSTRQAAALTGACLAIRRDVYLQAGGCDADHLPVTWNDSDLCLRIRALGLRAIWTPYARLLHVEQATRGSDDTPERQERFHRARDAMRARWNGAIDADPFLSPNLLRNESDPNPRLAVR